VWLEDQKIRHYKVEDRVGLRDIDSDGWSSCAQKYLTDLGCPYDITQTQSLIDWLLGFAVRLEYGDDVDRYNKAQPPGVKKQSDGTTGSLLDDIDHNSVEFKAGVGALAKLLEIPPHFDHLVVLKAVSLLITQRLSKEALDRTASVSEGGPPPQIIPLNKMDLGFETSDPVVSEAAKILRLLHVRELRDLQDLANQAIVAVQILTANPKTDSKLGKVGQS